LQPFQPRLLHKALAGISGSEITLEEFQSASGIASRSVARDVLKFLASQGIGTTAGDVIRFSDSDRLKAAVLAISLGCDVEQVSQALSWRDFERLASEILGAFGYRAQTCVRFVKPRMEIDVLGIRSGIAIVIDCKHWKRSNLSLISLYSKKQVRRAEVLLQKTIHDRSHAITCAVPMVLTLHLESARFVDGTPIVPVSQFRAFVERIDEFLLEIRTVTADKMHTTRGGSSE
jgi:hypothetical protein